MATAGQVIRNPVTGETVTFLTTAADSDGRLLRIEMVADPKAIGAPPHVHPRLTERYDLREGRLHVRLDGQERVLAAPTRFDFPRGHAHSWWNADDEPARVVVDFEPAGTFEYFMETVYALAADGKTDAKGRPKLLQAAVTGQAHLDDIALAKPPLAVQRLVFGLLAPIGRLAGYRARYPGRS